MARPLRSLKSDYRATNDLEEKANLAAEIAQDYPCEPEALNFVGTIAEQAINSPKCDQRQVWAAASIAMFFAVFAGYVRPLIERIAAAHSSPETLCRLGRWLWESVGGTTSKSLRSESLAVIEGLVRIAEGVIEESPCCRWQYEGTIAYLKTLAARFEVQSRRRGKLLLTGSLLAIALMMLAIVSK